MATGRLLALLLLAGAAPLHAELATERYAPAQLRVGHDFLEQAHAAAARGDVRLAGRLAWQAGLDARLAWRMTESAELRADAAELGGAANMFIRHLASDGTQ
jgi:hypothetical protein